MTAASDYSIDAYTWLKLYAEPTRVRAESLRSEHANSQESAVLRMEIDGVLDALEVVQWDSRLISAKLHRALRGKTDDTPSFDATPAQTDWNGSAKLALILAERSEAGWRLIARWAPETDIATQLADTLMRLRAGIERASPKARCFIRPGFDEPTQT